MIDRVTLTGPCAPADVADLLSGSDVDRAHSIRGYRGIPTSELARALVGAGVSVEIVSCADDIDAVLELSGPRVRFVVVPRRSRARHLAADMFREERRLLERELRQADGRVVHAHWTYEFAWAATAVRTAPVVITAHDAPLTVLRHYRDAYRFVRTLMAGVVRTKAHHLTAVSPYLADRWRREMLYRRPITIVPNIARDLGDRRAAGGTTLRIVDIADASARKNIRTLCSAAAALRSQGIETHVSLIGPGLGPDDALAQEFAHDARISFLGSKGPEELRSTLSTADLFVHPSREECCPVSVIEAMRVGVPVAVAQGGGGSPWVVDHGHAGFLLDVSTPSALADSLEPILRDPAERDRIGARGRARALREFSPPAVADAYLRVYDRVLAA